MSANPNPIFVAASNYRVALGFVERDLHDDGRRLRFVDRDDRLRGLEGVVLYLHPTAILLRDYELILRMAQARGLILARIDDSHARARHR